MGRTRTHNPNEVIRRVLSGEPVKAIAADLGMRDTTAYHYLHGAGFSLQYVTKEEHRRLIKQRIQAI